MLNLLSDYIVFLNINRKIKVFQNMHSLVAFSALRHHYQQHVEWTEVRHHSLASLLWYSRRSTHFFSLVWSELSVNLVPNHVVLMGAWYETTSFSLELLHSFDISIFIIVMLLVRLLSNWFVLQTPHENYVSLRHLYYLLAHRNGH